MIPDMRGTLLFMGWASVLSSLADAAIGLCSLWLAGADRWEDMGMTVDELLRQLLSFLHWMTQLAFYILPQDVPRDCFRHGRPCTFQSDSL